MQEGIKSLMQLAKTSGAHWRHLACPPAHELVRK